MSRAAKRRTATPPSRQRSKSSTTVTVSRADFERLIGFARRTGQSLHDELAQLDGALWELADLNGVAYEPFTDLAPRAARAAEREAGRG